MNIVLPFVHAVYLNNTTNRRVAPSEEWQVVINGPRKRDSSLKSYRNS